jgi:hypothetical protein
MKPWTISAHGFILYSTIAALFGTAVYFTIGGVMIQAFYLLMLFNLFLIFLMKRLWIPLGLLVFLTLLIVSGIVGVLRGTDSMPRLAKEFLGISISAFYFCCFFRTVDFKLESVFRLYARTAYWVAVIGIVLFPIRLVLIGEYRLRSILTEPSMFAITCIAALYYYADQWQRHRTHGRKVIVMLIAFILAGSSNGFLAILLGLSIFLMRYRRARFLLPALLLILGSGFYTLFSDVTLRINDSLRVVQELDLTDTNLSTWALFSNVFVAQQVLQEHPLLGNGLGSHGESYERFIGAVQGTDDFMGTAGEGLNAEDANSLATRVLSDMGFLGGALMVWFIWRYRPKTNSESDTMSKAIWLYFFLKLLRGGQYFSNEQYFFIAFYVLNQVIDRKAEILDAAKPRLRNARLNLRTTRPLDIIGGSMPA